MRFEAKIERRLGSFEAKQAAADDCRFLGALAVGDDLFEVFDGAINEDAFLLDTGQLRHKRSRAGCQHDDVVRNLLALGRAHDPFDAIDLDGTVAEKEGDAVLLVPIRRRECESFGLAMIEIFGEIDAIVSGARLFAESDDIPGAVGVELDKALAEAMSDHAVADDDDLFRCFCEHEGETPWAAKKYLAWTYASLMPAWVADLARHHKPGCGKGMRREEKTWLDRGSTDKH